MLRCDEVSRLCASEDVRRAPLLPRIAVRLHLMMCRHCRRYVRELAQIGAAARRVLAPSPNEADRYETIVRNVLSESRPPGGG